MTNFINTIDTLGDNVVADSIINRSIVECKDNIVSFIGDDAFYGCYELTTIDFPAVTNIGNSAFKYCASLVTTILRNESMVSLYHKSVFDNCYHIKGITNSTYNPTGAKNGYFYVPSVLYDSYTTDSNWSTYASQFRKLEEWTVDGTTTGELDLVNRHMVRFFNSDGTLLGYKVVATGGSASYDGDNPVNPENSSWKFKGFSPEATNVTEDVDCYAQYIDPNKFANTSWAEIAEYAESGEAQNVFALGSTKTFTSGDGVSATVRIIGFNHDDLADGTGKAGITLAFENSCDTSAIITTIINNEYGDSFNSGGSPSRNAVIWPDSELRKGWNGDTSRMLLTVLPDALQNVIKTVTKKVIYNGVEYTSNDKLWLWSLSELGFSDVDQEGECYEIYTHGKIYGNNYPELVKTVCGQACAYKTRSKYSQSTTINAVDKNGARTTISYSTGTSATFPCFCI